MYAIVILRMNMIGVNISNWKNVLVVESNDGHHVYDCQEVGGQQRRLQLTSPYIVQLAGWTLEGYRGVYTPDEDWWTLFNDLVSITTNEDIWTIFPLFFGIQQFEPFCLVHDFKHRRANNRSYLLDRGFELKVNIIAILDYIIGTNDLITQ